MNTLLSNITQPIVTPDSLSDERTSNAHRRIHSAGAGFPDATSWSTVWILSADVDAERLLHVYRQTAYSGGHLWKRSVSG